jgi:hypothetical protein
MAPWTFSMKFLYDTPFIFGSLMFTTGEDGNLELLTQGPTLVYGQPPYLPANPSTLDGACSSLNPYVGSFYHSATTSRGLPI